MDPARVRESSPVSISATASVSGARVLFCCLATISICSIIAARIVIV
jgi:hypothetical protein